MRSVIIGLLCIPYITSCTYEKWMEHTYHNDSNDTIAITTEYAQMTHHITQLRKIRAVRRKRTESSVTHNLNPGESKAIVIKGDPLSARRILSGSIKVDDLATREHVILPRHNVQNHNTFTICRGKKNKLMIKAAHY